MSLTIITTEEKTKYQIVDRRLMFAVVQYHQPQLDPVDGFDYNVPYFEIYGKNGCMFSKKDLIRDWSCDFLKEEDRGCLNPTYEGDEWRTMPDYRGDLWYRMGELLAKY